MIRCCQVFALKCRRWWALARIEQAEEWIISHQQQRIVLYAELKRIQTRIAMRESASNLLTEALRGKR